MITRFLRLMAVLVLVFTVALWAYMGANTGTTQYPHPIKGAENAPVEMQGKFLPGVEFLAGNAVFALLLFGLSFVPRKK
ncbi:MAG: hypothetical protein ABI615_04585 [Chthoniobacterales bacterium]